MFISNLTFILFVFLFGYTFGKELAPLYEPINKQSQVISDSYIVVLKPQKSQSSSNAGESRINSLLAHELWLNTRLAAFGSRNMGSVKHRYDFGDFGGYAGNFSKAMIDDIRQRPEVAFVEVDQIMQVMNPTYLRERERNIIGMSITDDSIGRYCGLEEMAAKMMYQWWFGGKKSDKAVSVQGNAPWGLARVAGEQTKRQEIDHEQEDFDTKELPPPIKPAPPAPIYKYTYPTSAGQGVKVYIIDTGIDVGHPEFEGRAKWGITVPEMDEDIDGNGHGTHCAGIVGSTRWGVAKKVEIIAVKVLRTSGFGSNVDVIKGIEWVIQQHQRSVFLAKKKGHPIPRTVANMSLGGGRSMALEFIINRAVELGVHFAVAAGNDAEDACFYSPAAAEGPITVGASNVEDRVAFFSNHGQCVDIFAPGQDILSTWVRKREESGDSIEDKHSNNDENMDDYNEGSKLASGTSMASPHIAGIMALYLGEHAYEPKALKAILISDANKNVLSEIPENTENRLACIRPLLLKT